MHATILASTFIAALALVGCNSDQADQNVNSETKSVGQAVADGDIEYSSEDEPTQEQLAAQRQFDDMTPEQKLEYFDSLPEN